MLLSLSGRSDGLLPCQATFTVSIDSLTGYSWHHEEHQEKIGRLI